MVTFIASTSEALPTFIWSEVIIKGLPVYSENFDPKVLGGGNPALESVSKLPP